MEVTDSNLQSLAGYLEQTLSPDASVRKAAEKFLESVEGSQNYPVLLLTLLDKDGVPVHLRVSSAVTFKNYTKRCWRVTEDGGDKIHRNDRTTIKQRIVGLMLKSPDQIQKQLSDAISIIGREDFPDKWPDLLQEMVTKFQTGDFHVINGILITAHSLFKRYRHEFKSQQLWAEIKFVLDNFAQPFTELFNATMEFAKTHAEDPVALKVIFSSIVLICKIFYSLNFQDLPEYFEDNMGIWMNHFLTLLSADNKILRTQDEEEAGLLEQVKSQICDNVALYAQKYDEEFSPQLPSFVTAIWNLLTSTGQQVKYDMLVSNAIQFLASVAERPSYKSLFEDPSTLASICEKVIVPNMQFRDADEELFEDNPDEYIRRDIEGSDVDTRRRSACDLVQALSKSFEGPVIQNFSQYVAGLLEEYGKNPSNWKSKDVAYYLVTSLAAKGQTQKHGITTASSLVNTADFFTTQVVPDLQAADVNANPILKADAIKFLMVFRSQLPKEALVASLPCLMKLLKATSLVVHSYAAHTIERLLMVRTQDGKTAAISLADIQPLSTDLISGLIEALNHPGSAENEYIMKALMRSMSALQEHILTVIQQVMGVLTQKLIQVSKNPSKPQFNHYLFECLCIGIRTTCKHQPQAIFTFEEALFKPFTDILQADVQEFIPYVFQILSLLIDYHTSGTVPDTYMALFPHLLAPALWERPGNIPPLVRLIQAYIEKGAKQIPVENVNGLLGVFQKLIASKANDHEGFYLLNSIIQHMPKEVVSQYVKNIFILLFQRLSSSKTTKYIKSLLLFFCLFAIQYGADALIQNVDGIQANMFGMVIEKLFLQDLQKVSGSLERKICAVGVTNVLTESSLMFSTYNAMWAQFLQGLISLIELPEDTNVPDDEHFIEIEDTPGYQTAYSQLAFAGKKEHDPVSEVTDVKINLARQLAKLSAAHPGKVLALISAGLQAEAQTFVQQYLATAGVTV
ncbi:exportin-2-like isoform X2 [Mytilus californianus]|nr:exportin-2-like isoform X2 [Mytilus californianus]XP_052087739.1 exportin-2-like isoform X2 [Mytilus californianus]